MSCITGDETGIVKVWDISKSSAAILATSFGEQNRQNGVAAMCWRDFSTQDVCVSRKNGVVEIFNVKSKMLSCKKSLGTDAVPACSSGFSVVRSKLVIVQRDGRIRLTPVNLTKLADMPFEETQNEMDKEKETKEGKFVTYNSGDNKKKPKRGTEDKNSKPTMKTKKRFTVGEEEISEDAVIFNDMICDDKFTYLYGKEPIDACHIHRRLALVACGGRENDLTIFDIAGERQEPVFQAKNVRDHVLDITMPVYVAGTCIISSNVSCVATAHHQVRFYDRRASQRPVQEFLISREVERRPTCMMQWNCNKFLIGETSGDVHLYDTRRGFTSRAKLRGGVGSVRCMAKHPTGHQILGVTGLDRKARLFHVPTGKILTSMYLKQRGTCLLLDKNLPLSDNVGAFSGITNESKNPERNGALGDELWDDMDPVIDDFEEKGAVQKSSAEGSAMKHLRDGS